MKNKSIRFLQASSSLAASLICAASFAQAPGAPPDRSNATVPAGRTQIEAPKDPLVQRREANKEASDEYKATKKAAKRDYDRDKKAARSHEKKHQKANDAAAKAQMPGEPKKGEQAN